jgi:hypothetical protein
MNCCAAEQLPDEWVFGSATAPIFTGMALTHFICRHCQWGAAADTGLRWQQNLKWLDISNPLVTPSTLPNVWDELPLETLKVRRY